MAPSLGSWLRNLRSSASGQKSPVLVAGNEAADADSIVSALVYAYFLSNLADVFAVPVVACSRADVCLRGETVLLLSLCGVDAKDLLCADDAETEALLKGCEKLVLVDHNEATGAFAQLAGQVSEILDHHKDMGAHAHVAGSLREIAFAEGRATAGSCCSLVAERFLSNEGGEALLAGDAARALLGVVLVDTVNFSAKAEKATARDVAAAEALQRLAPDVVKEELFAKLDAAKFDEEFWGELGVEQCLRYDFKQFASKGGPMGLCSVLCSLEALAQKEGFAEALESWAKKYLLFGVLSNVKAAGGGAQRQLLLMSADGGELAIKAADWAKAYEEPKLGLEAMALEGLPAKALVYKQLNAAASRKQVAPCLGAFLASL